MSVVTLRLPDDLGREVDALSKKEKKSKSELLREALRDLLEKRRHAVDLEKMRRAARALRAYDEEFREFETATVSDGLPDIKPEDRWWK